MEKEIKKDNKKIITIFITLFAVIAMVLSSYFIATKTMNKEKDESTDSKFIEKEDKESISPLVYKVTKDGSDNVIYLFGSMHIVNLDEFDFPKYVMDAFKESDYLAVEADIVEVQQRENFLMDYLTSYLYMDGTTIKDHLSEESYNKLVEFLKKKNSYDEKLEVYNLAFFESLISSLVVADAGINSNDGVDTYFLKKAKEDKKNILEVESFEFQEKMINSFPDRLFELSILSMIDNYDKQIEEMKRLYEIWKNGKESELIELVETDEVDIDEELSLEDKEINKNYNYEMIDKRNVGMKDKFESYFENNQKVLFIVGAAHIIGDNGIANLLIKDGYNVVAINR